MITVSDSEVGERVHLAAYRHHVTQEAIGLRLGLGQESVSRKMHGRSAFTVIELLAISEMLGVPVSDFLDDVPVPEYLRKHPVT